MSLRDIDQESINVIMWSVVCLRNIYPRSPASTIHHIHRRQHHGNGVSLCSYSRYHVYLANMLFDCIQLLTHALSTLEYQFSC